MENKVFFFVLEKEKPKLKAICDVMGTSKGEWIRDFCFNVSFHTPPPHHHSTIFSFLLSASTLIVLCNVLFSALSWLFILLVIPKNYFIILFFLYVACFSFDTTYWATRRRDVYRRMYLSTCIRDISYR